MTEHQDLGEERRTQILDAALGVFARHGFHKARVSDIAEAAGLSKGALYWYFSSKDAIIHALLARLFEEPLHVMHSLAEDNGSATARLQTMYRSSIAEINQFVHLTPLLYDCYALALRQKPVREYMKIYFAEYRELVSQIIRQGIAQGEFRPVDPEEAAIEVAALVEGLILLQMVDPQATDWDTLNAASLEFALRALQVEQS